jgi:hypothetical protein
MVAYDFFMIPMSAFDLQESGLLANMDWTTRVFWSLDLMISARTGIVTPSGDVLLDSMSMLKRYASTWLAFDVFLVASDWLGFLLSEGSSEGSDSSAAGVARIFRGVRIVRLARLVRIGRLVRQVAHSDAAEQIQSSLSLTVNVVVLLICVFSFSHVCACVWWLIGVQRQYETTWVNAYKYDEAEVGAQYLIALHWSLRQFSGGMDEVAPSNASERCYAVVLWLFCFVSAALIVSVLTSNMTQQHITNAGQKRQMTLLTKYLNQNDISSSLMLRLERCAGHAISGELNEDTVDLLGVVSESLKVEMHWEMYSVVLQKHTYFAECIAEAPQIMRKVCHKAASTLILQAGDVAFSIDEVPSAPRLYMVRKGTFEYDDNDEKMLVTGRQCISEAALWTAWIHRGTLTSIDDTSLVILDGTILQEILSRSKDFASDATNPYIYATEFLARLSERGRGANDLPLDSP